MKSFYKFINEQEENENINYELTASLLINGGEMERALAAQEIEVLYSDEDKMILGNTILKQIDKFGINTDNPYSILIFLEELGLTNALNHENGPFKSQFIVKKLYSRYTFDKFTFSMIPQQTEILISAIDEIPNDLLKGLNGLATVKIKNIDVKLPDELFDNLPELSFVSIETYQYDSLPEGLFKNNPKIKKIIIKESNITSIHENIFNGLNFLEQVSIDKCQIAELPKNLFSDNYNLRRISIVSNKKLTNLPVGLFDNLSDLLELSIGANRISELKNGIFSDLSKLQFLDLGFNPIFKSGIEENVFSPLLHLSSMDIAETGLKDHDVKNLLPRPMHTVIIDELPF